MQKVRDHKVISYIGNWFTKIHVYINPCKPAIDSRKFITLKVGEIYHLKSQLAILKGKLAVVDPYATALCREKTGTLSYQHGHIGSQSDFFETKRHNDVSDTEDAVWRQAYEKISDSLSTLERQVAHNNTICRECRDSCIDLIRATRYEMTGEES